MPTYRYIAHDSQGQRRTGMTESPSATAVVQSLRGQGWLVIEVAESAIRQGLGMNLRQMSLLGPRQVDVEISLAQLAVMLRSGLVLLSALRTVAEQSGSSAMRRVWLRVAERIEEGASFSEAMGEHRCFNRLVVQLVKVGETTGMLDTVLDRSARVLESRRQLRNNLLTAMAYPSIVFLAAIAVGAYMLLGVIPKLQTFLRSGGRSLPAVTQMLIDFSTFMQTYAVLLVVIPLSLIVAVIFARAWPPGRLWMDRLLLRLPVLGHILRLSATASFSRAMGILIRSGVTALEALRAVEKLVHNRFIGEVIANTRTRVMSGEGLSGPLSTKGAFMPMLGSMVAVGEAAGTLDDVLDEVARFHELRLQAAIKRLSTLVEPAIIIVVAVMVGFVYLAFFMAMISATGVR